MNPPRFGFVSTFSGRIAWAILAEVPRARIVHISFAREPIPLWAALVAVVSRRRVVLQPHGMLTARTSAVHRIVDTLLVRPLFHRAAAVVALSQVEERALVRWSGRNVPPIHVLGNPLPPSIAAEPALRDPPAADAVRVVFIARLHPRKRVVDFIAAAEAAASRGLPWRWVVIGPDDGDGALTRDAVDRIPALEYRGAVSADRVVQELETTTVFVMPSEREPWGNVLASAVALGIPSVVARSAALAPRIEASGAGRVIADRDPAALLAAVEDLLDPDCYRTASNGALQLRRSLLDPEVLGDRLVAVVGASWT